MSFRSFQVFFVLLVLFCDQFSEGSSFSREPFLKLDGDIIQVIAVPNILQCCWKCDRLPECFSLNVADVPDKDGLYECQMLRTETNKYSGLLKPSQHYHHYTRLSADKCETMRCLNGGTCDTRGYHDFQCRCPKGFTGKTCNVTQAESLQPKTYKWLNITINPVCFGAKDSAFGRFNITKNGTVTAVKLVHRSGNVTCNTAYAEASSNWGCAPFSTFQDRLMTIITNDQDEKILPQDEFITRFDPLFYKLPGTTTMSPELTFQNFTTPMNVTAGQEYRIWYAEDLKNTTEENNEGTSCTDVYMYGLFGV